jgi:hypothetical protein
MKRGAVTWAIQALHDPEGMERMLPEWTGKLGSAGTGGIRRVKSNMSASREIIKCVTGRDAQIQTVKKMKRKMGLEANRVEATQSCWDNDEIKEDLPQLGLHIPTVASGSRL